jgi:muramoyltetrapeptide carboxypeptidase LdcA involved in peptidoglycan recycling
LHRLKGIIIGKLREYKAVDEHKKALWETVNPKYGITDLPITANLNFGSASAILFCITAPWRRLTAKTKAFQSLKAACCKLQIKREV